jgi:hypothetical protein
MALHLSGRAVIIPASWMGLPRGDGGKEGDEILVARRSFWTVCVSVRDASAPHLTVDRSLGSDEGPYRGHSLTVRVSTAL